MTRVARADMSKHYFRQLLFTTFCTFSAQAFASFIDPIDGQFDLGHHLAENAYGFLPVPILITEPALGYGGGVAGVFLHESEKEKNYRKQQALTSLDGGAQLVPPAVTVVGAAGTENGSWLAFAGHRHSWLDDSIRYTGGIGVGQFKVDIYNDLGGLLPSDKAIRFNTNTKGVAGIQQLQFRVAKTPLMLGLKQTWSSTQISSDNQIIDAILNYTMGNKTNNSGLGLLAEYDTRNNLFYPTKGYSVAAEYMVYRESLGGDHNYDTLKLDGESYFPLAKKWTLGLAGNYQSLNSDQNNLSPTSKPYIGLRGIAAYRYQGDQVATLQTQLSYNITNRWIVSGFYGIGKTKEESIKSTSETVDAFGAGFRYQIARRYGIHLGMDLAFSQQDTAVYFSMGTGF
jgi:hypothetical protein